MQEAEGGVSESSETNQSPVQSDRCDASVHS